MTTPAFQTSGSLGGASVSTAAVPVPSGVANGDLILVALYKESTAAVTPPAGFTLKTTVSCTGSELHDHLLFYKHASGSDAGTYDFTWTGATWTEGWSARFTGAPTTGDPFGAPLNTATSNSGSSSTTTPAVATLTPSMDQCLVVFAGTNFTGGPWTPPSGLTERVDNGAVTMATLSQTTAAATGSISATSNNSGAGRTGLAGYLVPASLSYSGTADLSGSGSLAAAGTPGPTGTAALSGSGALGAVGVAHPIASDTFTGTNGDAWSGTWAAGQLDTGASALIQSNAGRVTTGSAGGYAGMASRKVNLSNSTDQVWLMKFRWPTGAECYPGIWLRAGNDALDAQSGYCFQLNRPASEWSVFKSTSYVGTDLASGAFSFASNTWYWVRCGVVGSALKLKIWADGASEPGAWTWEGTDTTYAGAGRCGIRVGPGAAASAAFDIDDFQLDDAFGFAVADTAVMAGSGALTATGVPTPAAAPSLTGSGALTATGVPEPVVTIAAGGAGSLTTTRTPAIAATAARTGSGALTATGVPAIAGAAATLAGAGTLSAITSPAVAGPATLAGSGTLGAVGGQVAFDTAARTGSGTLTAAGIPQPAVAAARTGEGQLSVAPTPAIPGAAAQTGTGVLAATVIPSPTGAVTRTGSGALTASGVPTPAAVAGMAGSGSLSAVGAPAVAATVALVGSGMLSVVAGMGVAAAAGLSGSGVLVAAGSPKPTGTATLTGAGGLLAVGTPRIPGSAVLSGSGALSATVVPTPHAAVALAGAGALALTRTPAIPGAAALAGAGALVVALSGQRGERGAARLAEPARRIRLGTDTADG